MVSLSRQSGELRSDEQLAGRIAAVDGFRGLAALAVLAVHVWYSAGRPIGGSHAQEVLATLIAAGFTGVDFFFVISGFVLFLPTCRNGGRFGSVRSYALRRAARILPLYWLMLVVLALTLNWTTTSEVRGDHIGLNLALHAVFLQHTLGIGLGMPEGFGLNGVVWTLSLEVGFYLMLPFVAARFYARPVRWFALFFAVSALWRFGCLLVANPNPDAPSLLRLVLLAQLPTYLPHFAFGMAGAWILVRASRPTQTAAQARVASRVALVAQAAGAIGVLWLMHELGVIEMFETPGPYDHFLLTLPVAAAFTLLLVGTLRAPRWAQRPFDNPVARKLGEISYGVYLWHLIVIGLLSPRIDSITGTEGPPGVVVLLAIVPTTIALAWLSHLLLEQPVIDWAKRKTTPIPVTRT